MWSRETPKRRVIRKYPGRKVAGKWKLTGKKGMRRLLAQSRMGNGELEFPDLAQQTALKKTQVTWSPGLSKKSVTAPRGAPRGAHCACSWVRRPPESRSSCEVTGVRHVAACSCSLSPWMHVPCIMKRRGRGGPWWAPFSDNKKTTTKDLRRKPRNLLLLTKTTFKHNE